VSFLKNLFSPPKPRVQEPVILDEKIDTAAEDAKKAAQANAKKRKGRRASILTSTRGLPDEDTLGSIKQTTAGGMSKILG
jgi:hypothetical protein